ncbi:MAG: hypothetical protein ACLQGP_40810 [Isosphaeraceae bacterium]
MNDPSSAWADYGPQSEESEEDSTIFSQSRMYIPEPGWRIGVKIGSTREFCYNRAPGQDYYHRLLDGEVFLHRAEEKLCVACAYRRGLIATEPKRLRDSITTVPADMEAIPLELGWRDAERS